MFVMCTHISIYRCVNDTLYICIYMMLQHVLVHDSTCTCLVLSSVCMCVSCKCLCLRSQKYWKLSQAAAKRTWDPPMVPRSPRDFPGAQCPGREVGGSTDVAAVKLVGGWSRTCSHRKKTEGIGPCLTNNCSASCDQEVLEAVECIHILQISTVVLTRMCFN